MAIDRATCRVFLREYADQSGDSGVDFLNRLFKAAPLKTDKVLPDDGGQFTDRCTSK